MLYTNLKHIESAADFRTIIAGNEHVVIICGSMGQTSIQAYRLAEELESRFRNTRFYDMEYDHPESEVVRRITSVGHRSELPLILFFRKGELKRTLSGIRSGEEMVNMLESELASPVN